MNTTDFTSNAGQAADAGPSNIAAVFEAARAPRASRTSHTAPRGEPIIPPILHEEDLPGPLSLNRLAALGTVHILDEGSGYWCDHASTLYGRAMIIHRIIPYATTACALTALWVWMGGDFPDTIDVLSNSHYRTPQHGRRVRVFSRKTSDSHLMHIGELPITTPTRTACDIASMFSGRPEPTRLADQMVDFMNAFDFAPDDCVAMLGENPYMATAPRARAFFNTVQQLYGERHCMPELEDELYPRDEADANADDAQAGDAVGTVRTAGTTGTTGTTDATEVSS